MYFQDARGPSSLCPAACCAKHTRTRDNGEGGLEEKSEPDSCPADYALRTFCTGCCKPCHASAAAAAWRPAARLLALDQWCMAAAALAVCGKTKGRHRGGTIVGAGRRLPPAGRHVKGFVRARGLHSSDLMRNIEAVASAQSQHHARRQPRGRAVMPAELDAGQGTPPAYSTVRAAITASPSPLAPSPRARVPPCTGMRTRVLLRATLAEHLHTVAHHPGPPQFQDVENARRIVSPEKKYELVSPLK